MSVTASTTHELCVSLFATPMVSCDTSCIPSSADRITVTDNGIDPEISAMGALASALAPLESDQQTRVLRWAADRYGLKGLKIGHAGVDTRREDDPDSRGNGSDGERPSYSSIDELFESGVAKTN